MWKRKIRISFRKSVKTWNLKTSKKKSNKKKNQSRRNKNHTSKMNNQSKYNLNLLSRKWRKKLPRKRSWIVELYVIRARRMRWKTKVLGISGAMVRIMSVGSNLVNGAQKKKCPLSAVTFVMSTYVPTALKFKLTFTKTCLLLKAKLNLIKPVKNRRRPPRKYQI